MPPVDLIVRSSRVVADNAVGPGLIFVRGEKIERVELGEDAHARMRDSGQPILDVGDLVVMPGLVDTHVHVNEPGRTDWEGFVTAGRAAAAGGITTIVVMPLNCTPAATNVAALMGEAEAARGKCLVDYGFWGGLVPGNVADLEPMWEAGALGFKCFMVESGVEDFGAVSMTDLELAAPVLARLGAPLLVHAEDPRIIAEAEARSTLAQHPREYKRYLATRPPEAEDEAAKPLAELCERFGLRVHIVHIAGNTPQMMMAATKRPNLKISGETCPHYLTFAAEDIPDGATEFKCAPPIRQRVARDQLWSFLTGGARGRQTSLLDMVVSDHSPCPPSMKLLEQGDFSRAWGGIASLQLGLSAVWTGLFAGGYRTGPIVDVMRSRYQSTDRFSDVSRWMSEAPADLAGLTRKGRIAVGCDASFVIFDPDEEWVVRGSLLKHRWKITPYDGMTLRGVVKRTILRGRTIYDAAASNPFPLEPVGQWIKRGST